MSLCISFTGRQFFADLTIRRKHHNKERRNWTIKVTMNKSNGNNVRSDFPNYFKWRRVNIMLKIIMASNCQLNNLFIKPLLFSQQSQNNLNSRCDFKSLLVYRCILLLQLFFFALHTCRLVLLFYYNFQLYARKLAWINNCVYLYCENIIGEWWQSRSWQIICLTTFILWKVNM